MLPFITIRSQVGVYVEVEYIDECVWSWSVTMVTYLYYTGTMLRENKVLASLLLRVCGLGPHGVSEVCNAVGINTTLTSLDLSGNEFDDQSIASLGKLLILRNITSVWLVVILCCHRPWWNCNWCNWVW